MKPKIIYFDNLFKQNNAQLYSDGDEDDVDLTEDLRIHTGNSHKIIQFLQDAEEQDDEEEKEEQGEKKNDNNNDIKQSINSTKPKKLTSSIYIKPNLNKKLTKKIEFSSSSSSSSSSTTTTTSKKCVTKIKNQTRRQLKLPYSVRYNIYRKEQQAKRYRYWKGNETQISIHQFMKGAKSIQFQSQGIAAFRDVMSKPELIKYGVLSVSQCIACLQISVTLFNSMWPHPMDKDCLISLTKKAMIEKQIKNELTLQQPIEIFIEWGIDNLYLHPGHDEWIDGGEKIIERINSIANQRGWTFKETFSRILKEWNH